MLNHLGRQRFNGFHLELLDTHQYFIGTLAHTRHSLNQGFPVKTPRSSISKTAAVIVIVSATAWSSMGVHAQDQTQTQTQVYGHQLMTDAERTAYQTKMRTIFLLFLS